jgi:adenylylsulfate kinase
VAWAIWITGLPGSGKTTIARAVHNLLTGERLKMLQLDEVRKVVTPQPKYTEEERDIVYSSLAYMAKVLTECGIDVIVDATAHRKRYRDLARQLIPNFAEVYVKCSLAVCIERESARVAEYSPKGIYRSSVAKSATVPGINVRYEETNNPEIVIDSEKNGPQEAAEIIVKYIGQRFYGR